MYSFQAGATRRKNKKLVRLLYIIIFILVIALAGVSYSYYQANAVSSAVGEALSSRALSEATAAQTDVYRLTQSSGSNTMTLLSSTRGHIYSLQSLNALAASIYGPGTVIVDPALLDACITTINECEMQMQSGNVLTGHFTTLRDNVDLVVASFAGE